MEPPLRVTRRVVRDLPPGTDWRRLVGGLRQREGFFWLDSALPGTPLGRSSFAGAEPWAVLRAHGTRVRVDVLRAVDPAWPVGTHVRHGDPLELARELLPPPPSGEAPPPVAFAGGAVAAFGYELADPWEAQGAPRGDGLGFPDLTLLAVDTVFAFDHLEGRAYAAALAVAADAERAAAAAEARLEAAVASLPDGELPPAAPPRRGPRAAERRQGFDCETHGKAVRRVQERITAGDVYQACLTHRIDVPCLAAAFDVYVTLRERSPAPFAAFLQLPGGTLLGSSPERFLRVADGWAESRPIKGTRPRRASAEEDRAERRALAASEKDRAENLMIVDLVRNDLGRVCEPGSVHVPELMSIEAYTSVFQMVSTVRGRLRRGCDALDAVRAAFPPGSMTGAPKLAAMALLRELETVPRGPYAGAIGYLDAGGGCDLSVVIRTAFLPPRRGTASVHTGGGIVHDSEPRAEWDEAEDKARPLLEAIADADAAARAAAGAAPEPGEPAPEASG